MAGVSRMFKKVFSGALALELGEATLEFGSPREFEFALAGRTGLSSRKLAAVLDMSDEALLREAEGIRQTEQRFVDVLSESMDGRNDIGAFLLDLDLAAVSQDNDWRAIVFALNHHDAAHEEYKKVALVKYLQYLTSRQEVLNAVYAQRQQVRKEGEAEHAAEGQGKQKMRDTLLFDLPGHGGSSEEEFTRLPKGESVEVPLRPKQSVALLLARHRFDVVNDGGFHLLDESGEEAALHPGKNLVGRDASSDVVIDGDYRDVSRKHLIIEIEGETVLRLTDISSLGSFVPPEFLERTGY